MEQHRRAVMPAQWLHASFGLGVSLRQGHLSNEKYKGDALLQKSYITDSLTKKQVKNEGEVRQYYVTGNHEPIIPPAVWDFVQAELAAPTTGRRSTSRQRKIRCAQCGA
ncbi:MULTISPECIES: recombinase family protein [unclassified Corynebacterium]|nr:MULTISPECIES: recombinase family protein [unclassified Corynebacterium]